MDSQTQIRLLRRYRRHLEMLVDKLVHLVDALRDCQEMLVNEDVQDG